MRPKLVAKGERLVEQGKFFTLFAPRQSGKTTYFQLLFRKLQTNSYLPIWISFEGTKTATRQQFYETLHWNLHYEFSQAGIQVDQPIHSQLDLQLFLVKASEKSAPLVLVIDEFENIPDDVISELLHIFRALYQKRQRHKLQSLILVGVSTVAELVVSSASPFNIVDQLEVPYFTFDEVQDLVQQYVAESGQVFESAVVKAIYDNTRGQPGLVSALCQYLVEEKVPDASQPVTMEAFYPTIKHFLTERQDKNILNIVRKAKEKPEFMLHVLFGETSLTFTIHDPTIAYLSANGVIENVDGNVEIPTPLYAKCIVTAFRPLLNGETKDYALAYDMLGAYASDDQLHLNLLLHSYRDYVQRRGFHAFDTDHLREGAWHYSLDGFLYFFMQRIGGDTLVEVPSGRGRTDILILYKRRKYIIETKVYSDRGYFEQGKQQLVDYLISEGLDEGYYVVFSNRHSDQDALYTDEQIRGKRLYTWIIRTDFKPASRRRSAAVR